MTSREKKVFKDIYRKMTSKQKKHSMNSIVK